MRPLRLEVQGFGPYGGTESVDFTDLAADGLFLIHGPTGAGKTALLDAMCFALYGQIPGSRTASGLRSQHASPDLTTEVRFEFAADGDHWLVIRRPGYDRPKHRGDGVTKEHPQARLFKREGTDWKPVAKATNEVNRELTDLLGLTHEQFARVIVLPQGQFQRVLRPTNAKEREELLTSLFDTELFGSIESWVQERSRTVAAGVADDQRTLEHLRGQASDRHQELSLDDVLQHDADPHVPAPQAGPGGALAVSSGERQIADQDSFDRVAEVTRRQAVAATDRVAVARMHLDRAHAAHSLSAAAADRWDRRAQLVAAAQELEGSVDTMAKRAEQLDAARAAAPLRTLLDAAVDAATALTDAQSAEDAALGSVRRAVRNCPVTVEIPVGLTTEVGDAADMLVASLRTEPDRALAGLAEQAGRLGQLTDLAEHRTAVRQRIASLKGAASASATNAADQDAFIERLSSDTDALRLRIAADQALAAGHDIAAEQVTRCRAAVAALSSLEALIGQATAAEAERERCRIVQLDARDAHQNLRERYLDGIAAALSAELADGDPCAVCGSLDHPLPASAGHDTDVVTRSDVDVLSAAQDTTELAVEHATAAAAGLQQQIAELRGVANEYSDATAAAEALVVATAGLTAASEAIGRIAGLESQLATSQSRISALVDAANQARLTAGEMLAEASTLEAQASAATLEIVQAFGATTDNRTHRRIVATNDGGIDGGIDGGSKDDIKDGQILTSTVPSRSQRGHVQSSTGATPAQDALEATADRMVSELDGARQAFRSVVDASRGLATAARNHSAAQRSMETAATQLADQLDQTRFATVGDARAALLNDRQIADLDRRVSEHRERVAGVNAQLEADDLAGLPIDRAPVADAERHLQIARAAERDAVAVAERTRLAAEAITRWSDEHRMFTLKSEPARREASLLHRLSDTLTGRSGSKVSLQRWVLAAFLDDVCSLANQRLTTMTGGRYTLLVHRGDTPGNRAAGLDLRVLDAHTGEERDVSTLSGGETFQASLALALAVADAVEQHAGGIRMEALFIDEGFGTLDPDALELAMDELDALRAGGRMVGIISHVGTMQERIRTGIRVQPSERGSTVHVGRIA